MRKEASIRGITMVFDEVGAGEAILLIHGQPFNRSMWDDQKEMLAKISGLIIPDLRGYGETGQGKDIILLDELALDLLHLLDHLSIKKGGNNFPFDGRSNSIRNVHMGTCSV